MKTIRVLVYAGAKKERVIENGEKLDLYVREPAQNNLANRRVVKIIADREGVSPSQVRILTGHRGPQKLLEVRDVHG